MKVTPVTYVCFVIRWASKSAATTTAEWELEDNAHPMPTMYAW
jgi:hypothetical protein